MPGLQGDFKDIFDLITEQHEANLEEVADAKDAAVVKKMDVSVVFCGGRQSGKSSLINSFVAKGVSKGNVPKPTVGLDYKFKRMDLSKSSDGSKNDTVHLWEVGGGEQLSKLLEVCMKEEWSAKTLVVIVVDLSRPHSAVADLRYWVQQTRARCNGFQQKEFLRQDRKDSVGDHEDVNKIDFLPVPCVVVANKWDAWKNADMEPLKAVAQSLRAIAHGIGAALLYTSASDGPLLNNFRTLLQRFITNKPWPKLNEVAGEDAIAVSPPGADSFSAIGNNAHGSSEDGWEEHAADALQVVEKKADTGFSSLQVKLAAEPVVDQMVRHKESDIAAIERKVVLDAKMKSI